MKIKIKNTVKSTNALMIIPVMPDDLKSEAFKKFSKEEVLSKKLIASFSAKKATYLLLAGAQTERIILIGLGEQAAYKNIRYAFRKFGVDFKNQINNKSTTN